MAKIVNLTNQNQKSLVPCADKGVQASIKDTPPTPICGPDEMANDTFKENISNTKVNLGKASFCDPMLTGQIVNDLSNPNRNVVYRYSKALRACDEAMLDLFRNLVVLDEDGKAHPIPIIWGSQERAVAAILQENVRKDNSLVVDRIKIPMLSIRSSGHAFDEKRYIYHKALDYKRYKRADGKPGETTNEKYERDTVFGVARGIPTNISYSLTAWTLYIEDMSQILEQIFLKFSPIAYIRVRGVPWETIVKLDSTANNIDTEPGDKAMRVVKYEFTMTAETYIPQPIIRNKAVLKTKINIFNDTDLKDATELIDRLEEEVKELDRNN